MKRTRLFAQSALAAAVALIFVATNLLAVSASNTALVFHVTGAAKYQVAGGAWLPMVKGDQLPVGATIQTGPDAKADLSMEGDAIIIHVNTNTTVKLEKMAQMAGGAGDSDTQVNVRAGQITGNIKKLSKASHFDIKTPKGVAGIRGTEFNIKVELLPDGTFRVTFTSVTGELVVAAIINGVVQTQALSDGQSWTPGSDAVPTVAELLSYYADEIREAQRLLDEYRQTGVAPPGVIPAGPGVPNPYVAVPSGSPTE